MHVRNCKKPELNSEKTPLLMCAFCKATFKTKVLIDGHLSKCTQRPFPKSDLDKVNDIFFDIGLCVHFSY